MPKRKNAPQSTISSSETIPTTTSPTIAAPVAETIGDIQQEIASGTAAGSDSEGSGERKRRGRPKGSRNREAEAPPDAFNGKALEGLIAFPFDYFAARRGEHWKLTDLEREALANATAAVANKYGESFGKYAPEISLVMIATGIVLTRLQGDAVIAEAQARESEHGPS